MLIEAYYIFAIVAVIGAAIGAYIDVKETWIPDSVNYFMIAFGLSGHVLLSFITNNWSFMIYSVTAFTVFFIFGSTLYYIGGTGGGDAKLFAGLAALLATYPAQTVWPFVLTVFMNGLIITAVVAAIILLHRFITKKGLTKHINPSKLMEGDWLTDEIHIGELHYIPKRTGIDKYTIEKLIKLESEGKLANVKIKVGFATGLYFLIGLLISLLFGDLLTMGVSFLL